VGSWLRLRRGGDGGRQSDDGCGRGGDVRVRVAWGRGSCTRATDRRRKRTMQINSCGQHRLTGGRTRKRQATLVALISSREVIQYLALHKT
jgi:hypothetical protein